MVSSSANLAKDHGILGYLHFLVFPLDLITSYDPKWIAARKQRICELTPIMFWLIPLIVILSGLISISPLGMAILYAIEVVLLTIVSMIYCWRGSLRFIIETAINYLLSFIIFGTALFFIAMLILPFGFCGIVVIVFVLISMFGRGGGGRYYDDDDDW